MGAAKAGPIVGTADRDVSLFDKWIEERETQAAESWRIRRVHMRQRKCARRVEENSGDLCVSSHHHRRRAQGTPRGET
jgi:hypothetical protein